MRAIILFMLLLPVLHSQGFDYAGFSGTQNFMATNFTHDNQSAQAVLIGTDVQAILLPSLPFGELYPTTDAGEIKPALESLYKESGYSLSALSKMPSIHAGIISVRKNKDAGEAKCRILTGADRSSCTDFESCQKACYSVTSFCMPVALGAGRDFVYEIVKFENSSKELDSAYRAEANAYSALASVSTQKNVELYLESLSSLSSTATQASKNALFGGYSYCNPPDYSVAVITNMQISAQKYWQNASHFYFLEDESQAVKVRTMEGLQRLANLPEMADNASLGANGTDNATKTQNPPFPDGTAALLVCAFASIAAIAVLFFALFSKKKRL